MKKILRISLVTVGLSMAVALCLPGPVSACDCGADKEHSGCQGDCKGDCEGGCKGGCKGGCGGDVSGEKSCGGSKQTANLTKGKKAPRSFAKAPKAGVKATCPISGREFTVKKNGARSVYKGRHYAFCCPGCKGRFDGDPKKFSADPKKSSGK